MKTAHAALAMTLLLSISAKGDDMKSELEDLAGVWTCIAATNNGKPVPEQTVQKLRLTLTKEGGYKTELGDQVLFDSTCQIDPAAEPKQIDMIGTEGENKGKAAQGIYKRDGDALTICYTMPGKPRPEGFESKPGSEATLVTWKR
jgi:uncharacterized protein (TIGR03067 family)